ncbi:TAXI family TRAP transporter solute-binding subunit [Solirubrobacter ginsenosidimutans]|uniref:TAXI family TRAP transporter solute-binding subunit n=1 Tax=Solirubrobacter ginsenosidimutans TaxID=490573 RepID=A0A9X3N171_9ACTN|nr:TAXI family TRAP transporter solute-binding subunit [Solirubrobacter ginsenosidimutans]MDA0165110.1 TAXI family TRAP transporter solute-binding subunit [Solirubrobacter ginsenosidimutans]
MLRAVVTGVLAALALAGCVQLTAHGASTPRGRVVIAAGGTTGVYYAYAQALAHELEARAPDLRVDVVATSGSMENLRKVDDGEATLAFTAADAAAVATEGAAPFARRVPITALARVYDDYLHVVVPASSGVRSIAQLSGRTVSIGPSASGTRLIAERLLGEREGKLHDVGLSLDASVAALRDGSIAAFFWSGGLPTPGVEALSREEPVRLLALDRLVDRLQARYGASYRAAAIPSGTYGLARQVSTLAVPNLIVAPAGADAALIRLVVATLFERRAAIARAVPAAVALDRRAAIETAPVPLHAAALRWFRDTKP